MAPGRPGTAQACFTLIEMLTVLAILLILLALLLPVLTRARQWALLAGCISNVRQLGIANTLYAVDADGSLPFANWWTIETVEQQCGGVGWCYDSRYYRYPQQPSPDLVKTGILWPYLTDQRVYRCPGDLPPDPNCNAMTSFQMSGVVNLWGTRLTALKTAQLLPDGMLYFELGDCEYNPFFWNDAASYPYEVDLPELWGQRHLGKYSIVSLDASVDVFTYAQYQAAGADPSIPKPNRVWPYREP